MGCRAGGIRTGWMQERTDAGKEGCMKGGSQDWRDTGKEGSGQERYGMGEILLYCRQAG